MVRMKPLVLALCLVGCTDVAVETEDIVSYSAPLVPQGAMGQGSSMQGSSMQGVRMNGSSMQGATMDASSLVGGTQGGIALSDATVEGTAIKFWKRVYTSAKQYYWEYRTPNQLCKWNASRTALLAPCTSYTAAQLPTQSPVIGSTWQTTFIGPDGEPLLVTLQIDTVRADTTYAMHPLLGAAGVAGNITFDQSVCSNLTRGCRQNSDMFDYDVRAIDVVENGQHPSLCAPNETALAFAGRWQSNGTYQPTAAAFTLACTNGVIAKCARWGYRPYGSAYRANDGTVLTPMADYHRACTRAAMADYCGNGYSFTKTGTLVDVYDFTGNVDAPVGFVPPTQRPAGSSLVSAFAYEGWFDRHGATLIDSTRYAELVTIPAWNPEAVCPDRFAIDVDHGELEKYWRLEAAAPFTAPFIKVDSSPACSHSELKTGKWLHRECSYCTAEVPTYCNDPASPQGWNQACVDAVRNHPTCANDVNKRMAAHSECTSGIALDPYDSGCTLRVCSTNSACCTSGWTAACVNLADAMCTGGSETMFQGFCALSPVLGLN